MRKLATLITVAVCLVLTMANADADATATITAVKTAFNALDAAFERQDAKAIESMMTADHLAVTPYYDAPKTVAETLESLSHLKTKETPVSKMTVSLLGPDAAMIIFLADMEGSFMGIPLPSRGFVTSIMVRRDGRWLERLYQVTALE